MILSWYDLKHNQHTYHRHDIRQSHQYIGNRINARPRSDSEANGGGDEWRQKKSQGEEEESTRLGSQTYIKGTNIKLKKMAVILLRLNKTTLWLRHNKFYSGYPE